MSLTIFCRGLIFILIIDVSTLFLTSAASDLDSKEHEKETLSTISSMKIDVHHTMRAAFISHNKKLAKHLWLDMKKHKNAVHLQNQTKIMHLSFSFEFYDQNITELCVSQLGEIYDVENKQLAIFALFALDAKSEVTYVDTGDSLVVQWEKFKTEDLNGDCSFQVTLYANGSVDFIYKNIPISLKNATSQNSNIVSTFGVSYVLEVLYENNEKKEKISLGYYFDMNNFNIRNATVVRFEPVPLCLNHFTCVSCASSKIQTYLNESHPCFWCPGLSLCSSKQDFLKNIWSETNCSIQEVESRDQCFETEQEEVETDRNLDLVELVLPNLISIAIFISLCVCASGLGKKIWKRILDCYHNFQDYQHLSPGSGHEPILNLSSDDEDIEMDSLNSRQEFDERDEDEYGLVRLFGESVA